MLVQYRKHEWCALFLRVLDIEEPLAGLKHLCIIEGIIVCLLSLDADSTHRSQVAEWILLLAKVQLREVLFHIFNELFDELGPTVPCSDMESSILLRVVAHKRCSRLQ